MISHWTFDEGSGTTVLDVSGNSNDAVVNGAQWVAELTGSALLFDGIDDFVGTGVSLLNELDAFTLSGWFAPSVGGSVEGFFGENDLIEFGFYQSTTLGLYTDAGGNLDFLWSYPLDEWHHVAVTGDANGVRLHIDGVQVVEVLSPAASGYGSTDFPFNIGGGGIWDASGNAFAGRIDEVAVYGRALGASEYRRTGQPGFDSGGSDRTDYKSVGRRNDCFGHSRRDLHVKR